MTLSKRWQSLVVASVLLSGTQVASGLVLFGADTGGATDNTKAPANGAPWEYVASVIATGGNASGVYLGYGFVLTANHVNNPLSVSISGSMYALDESYVPLQIGGADLKLLRIVGDPGLAPMELIGSADVDTGRTATFIGYGVGKGAEVPNQGWEWGDDSTRMQRWGMNVTQSSYLTVNGSALLVTSFDRPGAPLGGSVGEDEFSLSLGDSGGGLFVQYGGTWKLVGIAASVENFGYAFYDKSTTTPLDQPARSFYTPVKLYREAITLAIPEPSAGCLVFAGTAALLGWLRPRRE